MAAIPTFWYVGDPQINGGFESGGTQYPQTGFPVLWGYQLNWPRFARVVPSGPDGVNGGTYSPYWDGQLNSGTGGFVRYAHTGSNAHTGGTAGIGDNWYLPGGGGISPCTMLMNGLAERYPEAPGFKLLKFAVAGGFGTGSQPLKQGAAGWNLLMTEWAKMQAAVAPGDTLDLQAVIVDATATDLANGNPTYVADIQSFIDGVRAIAPNCLIVLVSHKADLRQVSAPNLATLGRLLNLQVRAANTNMRLFDMSWAQWGSDSPFLVFTEGPDNLYYRVQDYIEAGARLARIIDASFQDEPEVGTGIPVVAMIGDSQFVTLGADPQHALTTNSQTLLGNLGGTDQETGLIWNAQEQQVQPYDVLANASTFGDVVAWFGPEVSLLAGLGDRFPNGVVVWKYAKGGIPLTVSAMVLGGGSQCLDKQGNNVWNDLSREWAAFRRALQNDLGLTADLIAICQSTGANDLGSPAVTAEFIQRLPIHVDDLRGLLTTRTDGKPVPYVIIQIPKPESSGAKFGTPYGDATLRESVRTAIANLPNQRENVRVLLDPGDRYELIRFEDVHYAASSVLKIGYDLAAEIIGAIDSDEGGTDSDTATAVVDLPSESAAFTVEDGSGLTSANSYASVAFADEYHQTYGNPSAWLGATSAARQNALRLATQFLDLHYGGRWVGVRGSSEQALDWPRSYVVDAAGNDVAEDSVPLRIQQAAAKAALLHMQGNTLLASAQTEGDVSSESVSLPGGLSRSVTYIGGKPTTTRYPIIDRMFESAGFIESGAGWGYSEA